jgi:hypothetical protein
MADSLWINDGNIVINNSGLVVCSSCPCLEGVDCEVCFEGKASPYLKLNVSGMVGRTGYSCKGHCPDGEKYSGEFILPFAFCKWRDSPYRDGRVQYELLYDDFLTGTGTGTGDLENCDIYSVTAGVVWDYGNLSNCNLYANLRSWRILSGGNTFSRIAWAFNKAISETEKPDCLNWDKEVLDGVDPSSDHVCDNTYYGSAATCELSSYFSAP